MTQTPMPLSPIRARLILVLAAGSSFLIGFGANAILVTLPEIARGLRRPPLEVSGLVTFYMLGVLIFTPLSGWLRDRVGLRRAFLLALAAAALGTSICGLLPARLETMYAGRLLQGFGSAMLGPLGQIALLGAFPRSQMVRVTGYTVMLSQLGPLVAPLAGAAIAAALGWRAVFLCIVPIQAAGMLLAWRLLPDDAGSRVRPRFDGIGFLLLASGLACLMIGLNRLQGAGLPPALLASPALLAAFLVHARRTRDPLVDLTLLRRPVFALALIPGGVSVCVIATVAFVMPLRLQLGLGLSALDTGKLMVCVTLGIIGLRNLLPGALRRFGFRTLLIANGLALSLGVAALALQRPATPFWLAALLLFGFGGLRSFHWSNLTALSYSEIEDAALGRATALTALGYQFAQTLGVGLASAMLRTSGAGGLARFDQALFALALLGVLSTLAFRRLAPDAGAAVSNHSRASGRLILR